MSSIEEIKGAAISAIMAKEEEIEQFNKAISKYELMESELRYQVEKNEAIERQTSQLLNEKDQELKEANDKIIRERQHFFNKIESLQGEAFQEEKFK